MRRPSIKGLRKKAWKLMSEYVRRKDRGICITCGARGDWKDMNAGHFVHRDSLDFDLRNINCQCLTEHSKIRMADGSEISIKEISPGEKVMAFDDKSFKMQTGVVEEVSSFIPANLYRVELENGEEFMATPDHMVVANGAWHSIEEMLHSPSAFDILSL